jgi:hypothetical protein
MPSDCNVQIDPNGELTTIEEIAEAAAEKENISLGIASDGLMYVFINGKPVGTGIPQGQSGDVFGYVDENNTVVLNGNLADGTYTFAYECEDGTMIDIGTMTKGAKPLVPNFTNLADPTSADWLTDNRLNSSGGGTANPGTSVTNYIAVTNGDVIRVKGLDMTNGAARIAGYNGSKAVQFSASLSSTAYATDKTVGADESVFKLNYSGIAFLRVSGGLSGKAEDVIVTKNEEITYS